MTVLQDTGVSLARWQFAHDRLHCTPGPAVQSSVEPREGAEGVVGLLPWWDAAVWWRCGRRLSVTKASPVGPGWTGRGVARRFRNCGAA